MKKSFSLLLALLATFGFAGLAGAHVTVQPSSVPAGSYQVFTVRVPSEKEAATTQVKVAIPDQATISRFEPKPDWSYEVERNADNKIVSVTWTATGDGIGATEFGEFRMQGRVADDASELTWRAYQTYSDGDVVEWTGAPDADTPASVTAVTAATGNSGGHGVSGDASAAAGGDGDAGRDPLTLSIAIAGLVAGVLALIVALVRKPKRG
ncbi:YcnI family protein [Paenibacillaceae bacterium WGS1546]|uniref:YcnI family copper-binding membrane protein n=1 Tax=Cohnella sp. WGS1546 TaxID=3366810 RepID=UPI00372D1E51